jgi:2-iminobutanoate/2-iminopropanoate deaminase
MKKIINIPNAPAPVGPYNQAVLAGNTLYCSGQIPLIPSTGELLEGTIQEETRQVMENLKAVLAAAGATFENAVKCSIFMSSMDFYGGINEVYAEYFDPATAPAREAVAVKTLPKNVNVEISLIASL